MNILKRLFNAIVGIFRKFVDKIEDPEIVLDQQLESMNHDLSKIKANTANVIATKKGLERKISVCKSQIEEYDNYARVALKNGNEEDAIKFIDEQLQKEEDLAELNESLNIVAANAAKIKTMHNDFANNLARATEKSDLIKSKIKVAQTQEIINKINESSAGINDPLSGLKDIDEKIARRLDESLAFEEVLQDMPSDKGGLAELKTKYDNANKTEKCEERLAALKASLAGAV